MERWYRICDIRARDPKIVVGASCKVEQEVHADGSANTMLTLMASDAGDVLRFRFRTAHRIAKGVLNSAVPLHKFVRLRHKVQPVDDHFVKVRIIEMEEEKIVWARQRRRNNGSSR